MVKKFSRRIVSKLNNNGSTMLIVMVALALISILATTLMAMSYMNYNMKVTELNSKKNFYSAEIVLDQINVGLQKEISDSVEDAYIRSMQNYKDSNMAHNTTFASMYINELRNKLRTVAEDTKYEIAVDSDSNGIYEAGLVKYLDSNLQNAYKTGKLQITSTDSKMDSVAVATTDETGATVYDVKGLMLYNLRIEYTDSKEFTSVIETDIKLKVPTLTLVTKTVMPNVFDYSLVADSGIVGGSGANVTFEGNVYAGNDTTLDEGGVSVTQGHTWNFTGNSRLISAGPLAVAPNASFSSTLGTDLWLDGIKLSKIVNVTSGTINLAGSTYVADDLTIEGNGGTVTLSGNYFGFGNGATAEESSAIVLNGKNATLDMTGIDNLMLGGNAYIQTSQATYTANENFAVDNNKDVLLGNSLAVKSDQIVYLVPAECVGVNNGNVLIGRNPMNEAEYLKWKDYQTKKNNGDAAYAGYEAIALTKKTTATGRQLNEYDLNDTGYKTVFRQINGETLCYLYLDLTSNGAATYYEDYYNKSTTKMNNYIAAYNNRVLMNPTFMTYETKGTMLSYALDSANGEISIVHNSMDAYRNSAEIASIEQEQGLYKDRFARLKAKLTLDQSEVTATELTKTVYHNLIKDMVVSNLTETKTYELKKADNTVEMKAVFVNNRGGANYVYDDPLVCVIVATGDVVLKRDFEGLIITDGKIIIESGTTSVKPNKEKVLKMLRSTDTTNPNALSLIAIYFIDGDKYSMVSSLTSQASGTMKGQSMGELIEYENWAKQ